ncbi:MAG: PQQ-like beta-propeller repeat protein, partial [Ignavibacteriaceae bacterium]|nr:PQQ-like beta-propeller repeat protein [Ignavibacteriaceae bacterium]
GIKRYYSIIIAAVVSLISFTLTTCNPTEPICPEPKPPGYQEDIPWPSLADSPWPMNHADPQSTGRSKYVGPNLGQIDWRLDSLYMGSGVSIGKDNTMYFISFNKKGLFAVSPDGKINWQFKDIIFGAVSTPIISKDGTIYISCYAIQPDGKIKWKNNLAGGVSASMNIDKEGNIYVLAGGGSGVPKLLAVDSTGNIFWTYENSAINNSETGGISFSPEGNAIYVTGNNPSLLAIDIYSKALMWQFGNSPLNGAPQIDALGNIYLASEVDSINSGRYSVYCLRRDGTIKWNYDLGYEGVNRYFCEGTIDKEGNYYFATDTLYSFNYKGGIRWKLFLGESSWCSLVCDAEGTIFLNVGVSSKYFAVSKHGNVLWTIDLDNQFSGFSPALGSTGHLYIPTWESKYFYAIK